MNRHAQRANESDSIAALTSRPRNEIDIVYRADLCEANRLRIALYQKACHLSQYHGLSGESLEKSYKVLEAIQSVDLAMLELERAL